MTMLSPNQGQIVPEFQVEGMSCEHCVKAVTRSIHEIDPAARVQIDISLGKVEVESSRSIDTLKEAIDEAGYTVVSATTA